MKKSEFREKLAERISAREEEMLRSADPGLYVSDFNREVCLRILDETSAEGDADDEAASLLEGELRTFLSEYMADHPEAHKWIILSCLELTFVEGKPMHPKKSAGWEFRDGEYYCPSMAEGTVICSFCACRKAEDKEKIHNVCGKEYQK